MAFTELKEYSHRGGALRFSVPANWTVETEANDDGDEVAIFYDEGDETGVLRVDFLSFESPKPVTNEILSALLDARQGSEPQPIEELPSGNLLRTYREESEEDGEKLQLYFWDVAHAHPPSGVRLAIFSYTVLDEFRNDEEIQFLLKLIDGQIRKVAFA